MPQLFQRGRCASLPVVASLAWAAAFYAGFAGDLSLKVESLCCEGRTDPQAVSSARPHLSWLIVPDGTLPTPRGVRQTAWQILASKTADALARNEGDLWDSGRVESDQSIQIPYAGRPPAPSGDCWWKVRVWATDALGRECLTPWSRPAFWRRGPDRPENAAAWIGCNTRASEDSEALTALYRHDFLVEKEVARAVVYYSSTGHCELFINAERIGDGIGIPASTDSSHRILYLTHEVSRRVSFGRNAVGLLAFPSAGTEWKPAPVWLLLIIEHPDGTRSTVATGKHWEAAFERDLFPANQGAPQAGVQTSWARAGFQSPGWSPASSVAKPAGRLLPQMISPPRMAATLAPAKSEITGGHTWRFDFGQIIQGRPLVRGIPQPGAELILRPLLAGAPVHEGTANWKMVGNAGAGVAVPFERRYPVIRFDSVEVQGFDPAGGGVSAEAAQINDDIRPASSFSCSDPQVETEFREYRSRLVSGCFGVLSDLDDGPRPLGHLGGRALSIAGDLMLLDLAPLAKKWHQDILDSLNGSRPGDPLPAWAPPVGAPPPADWEASLAVASVPLALCVIAGDRRPLEASMPGIRSFVRKHSDKLLRLAGAGAAEGDKAVAARDALIVTALALFLGGAKGEAEPILDSILPDTTELLTNAGVGIRAAELFHLALGKSRAARHLMDLGGIRPDPMNPGFKRGWISPRIPDGIMRCDAGFLSPHGWFRCSWSREEGDGAVSIRIEIPPNASALLSLPIRIDAESPSDGKADAVTPGLVRMDDSRDGEALFQAGSGIYEFVGFPLRTSASEAAEKDAIKPGVTP